MKDITHLLQSQLSALIRRYQLFSPHEMIVLGVSGGTDSLALAHILTNLAHKLQIQIHIVTYHHGIRPEAEREVLFVQDMAVRWGVACTVGYGDVYALQQAEKLSLEEAARKARYLFFAEVASKIGAKTVVTAHHQDDQAETVLLHLIRGAGGQGAIGMQRVAPLPYTPHLRLVRPLLTISRQELESYCTENSLAPVNDPSNADVTLIRNAVRHQIMPLLQHINPQASSALNRFAQIYADEQAVLAEIFQTMIMPHITQMDGRFFIPKAMFLGWHIAWQRKIFYHLLPISELTYAHVAHAIDVVHFGENGAIAQFPLGWQMRIDYDQLVIESTDASPFLPTEIPLLIDTDDVAISLDVAHEIDGRWFLHITQASQVHRLLPQASINIPPDAQMMLRTRRPSDRFAPLGLQGKHQSIKDWMINQKISKIMRPMIPLLTINNEIAVILYGKKFVTSHFFTIKEKNTPIYNIFVYFQNP